MNGHADTIRRGLTFYIEGKEQREGLAALDALLAENQRLERERDLAEGYISPEHWASYAKDREALAGDAE